MLVEILLSEFPPFVFQLLPLFLALFSIKIKQ